MSRGIPPVRVWRARILNDGGGTLLVVHVHAPTKFLARLNFRHDWPAYLGRAVVLSVRSDAFCLRCDCAAHVAQSGRLYCPRCSEWIDDQDPYAVPARERKERP